jgi:hypothetical protein
MNTVELARRVVDTGTAHHFRDVPGEGLEARPWTASGDDGPEGGGWIVLDLFTAGAIVAVANNVNDANRAKLAALHPIQAQDVCLALFERIRKGAA